MTDQTTQPVQPPATVQASQTMQPPAPVQAPAPVQVAQPVQAPAPIQPAQAVQPATPENPYQSIIDQQNAQIAALMQHNQALNAQVTQMVQSGAQFNGQAQQQAPGFAYPNAYGGVNNPAIMPQSQEFPPVYAGNDVPLSLSSDVDVSLESLAAQIGKKE